MKLLIAALLSVALFWTHTPQINNSEARIAVAKQAQTATNSKKVEPKAEIAQEAPAPTPPPPEPQTPPTHEDLMLAAGISPSDFTYVDYIISHESSWNSFAQEPTSGAFGLCQALPAIKLASAGEDWQTNPVTQLKWCTQYAVSRYGSWAGAYNTWVAQRWW